MSSQTFPYSSIYNDIDKVHRYWGQFKPAENNGKAWQENWRVLIPFLEQTSYQDSVQIVIWDVLTNHFIYEVDKRNVAGYDASLYLAENGVDFSIANIHPHYLTPGLLMQQKAFEY